jgi:hypothetical protein
MLLTCCSVGLVVGVIVLMFVMNISNRPERGKEDKKASSK